MFEAFCKTPMPWGLGYELDAINAIIDERKSVEARARQPKSLADHGTNQYGGSNTTSIGDDRGADYLTARIARDHPAIRLRRAPLSPIMPATMTSPRAVPVPEPAEPRGGTDTASSGTVRYSVPEAARILGISERGIRKRIDAGTLFATRDGRAWIVYLEEPASGAGTAESAVPSEPRAVPGTEPEPERAVSSGTSSAVDLSPLVALVDDLTRRNAELTEAATLWQFRARQLEEQIKQLIAGDVEADDIATEPHNASPAAPGATEAPESTPDTSHEPSVVTSWLRRLVGRS